MNTKAQDMQVVREAIIKHLIAEDAADCAASLKDPGALLTAIWHESNMFREQTILKVEFARKYGHLP